MWVRIKTLLTDGLKEEYYQKEGKRAETMHHPFLSSPNVFHSIQFLHSSQTQFCVIDYHPKVSASSFHVKSNKLPQALC